jgi:hypothetical protein
MDEQSAELYKASKSIQEWFEDHWHKIVEVLEKIRRGACLYHIEQTEQEKLIEGLKVVDPTSRLVELEEALDAYRPRQGTQRLLGATVEVASSPPKAALESPGQLLERIVILNARITEITARIHLGAAMKPSELDALRPMVDNLAGLLRKGR